MARNFKSPIFCTDDFFLAILNCWTCSFEIKNKNKIGKNSWKYKNTKRKIIHEFEPIKRTLRKKLKNKTKSGKKRKEDFFFEFKTKKFFLIKTKQTTKNPILYVLLLWPFIILLLLLRTYYQNEPHSNTSSEPCVKKMFYLVRLARINITSMMTKRIPFHLFQLFRSEFVVGADGSRILQNFKNWKSSYRSSQLELSEWATFQYIFDGF